MQPEFGLGATACRQVAPGSKHLDGRWAAPEVPPRGALANCRAAAAVLPCRRLRALMHDARPGEESDYRFAFQPCSAACAVLFHLMRCCACPPHATSLSIIHYSSFVRHSLCMPEIRRSLVRLLCRRVCTGARACMFAQMQVFFCAEGRRSGVWCGWVWRSGVLEEGRGFEK